MCHLRSGTPLFFRDTLALVCMTLSLILSCLHVIDDYQECFRERWTHTPVGRILLALLRHQPLSELLEMEKEHCDLVHASEYYKILL